MDTGIQRAVTLAGSQFQLAEVIGVTQQAISLWLARGWVPAERAREIEMVFGVPRLELINPKILDMLDVSPAL